MKKYRKKVCVITGSRAEYDLLKPLMVEINSDKDLELQLLVTGMHLSAAFGNTYKIIEKDKFKISKKINIDLCSDTPKGISRSMGLALTGFSEAFSNLKPDLVVVLGDRFEIFSAVTAAHVAKIPVAHIHGGEVTEGAIDDAFRHCITKMSQIHFTSTEQYRERVIQLGESPKTVFNVGSIGVDNIKNIKLLHKKELEKKLNFKFGKKNLLVTCHPVTLEKNSSKEFFKNILFALDAFKDINIIFTKANADTDGRIINRMIDTYVKKNKRRAVVFTSMGQVNYFSTVKLVDAVVGNSSSGIIEVPSFKTPTINIGDRQKGRIMARSVINCKPQAADIVRAINKVYYDKFNKIIGNDRNPYSLKNTTKNIVSIIKRTDLTNILKKRFYNLNHEK